MLRRLRDLSQDVEPPRGFQVDPWSLLMLPASAAVLRASFIASKYLNLYPQLGSRVGCAELINELTDLGGFLPEASFMISKGNEPAGVVLTTRAPGCVFGQIHVVAVVPRHRRKGIGKLLINQALWGLYDLQLPFAMLNICQSNRRAIRFFRQLGFKVNSSGFYV